MGSTDWLGAQFWQGTCLITIETAWANGVLVLRGDLIVPAGLRLTLENVTLLLDPASEQQWKMLVDGELVMRGGALGSNTTHHWRLRTSGPVSRVDLDGVNVSRAGANGGGPYSGFDLAGGNGHRFRRLAVADSANGPDWNHAVFSTWSPDLTNLRIEDSLFRSTGRVLQMVAAVAAPTDIVFQNNTIIEFDGTGGVGAIDAFNLDVVNNTIDTGTSRAIWISHGGGPGWPRRDYHHRVTGNTVTTSHQALVITGGSGYLVTGNTFRGRVFLLGSGDLFEANTIRDVDETQPVVMFNQNGSVCHNNWRNVTLHEQAALVNWGGQGNVSFFANSFELSCAGLNCMAIEVINVLGPAGPLAERFPLVEVSWNNITWLDLPAGTDSVSLDNEFSRGLYVHNNSQRVALREPGAVGAVTTSILAGGLRDSVLENNTLLGPQRFGIYHIIYEDARNVFQFNRFADVEYAGIFQAGGSVVRHNHVEVARNGWWICPNRPCAGGDAKTANLTFYDNTLRFRPGGQNVTRMTWPDFLNNTFVGRGDYWSNDSRTSEPVPGGWLFFANDTIERVAWSNESGARRVDITVRGMEYDARDPDFGAEGWARVSVTGALDRTGSIDARILLRSLDPNGTTDLTVSGKGPAQVSVDGFRPRERYRLLLWDSGRERWLSMCLETDPRGAGSVTVDLEGTVGLMLRPWGSWRPIPGTLGGVLWPASGGCGPVPRSGL